MMIERTVRVGVERFAVGGQRDVARQACVPHQAAHFASDLDERTMDAATTHARRATPREALRRLSEANRRHNVRVATERVERGDEHSAALGLAQLDVDCRRLARNRREQDVTWVGLERLDEYGGNREVVESYDRSHCPRLGWPQLEEQGAHRPERFNERVHALGHSLVGVQLPQSACDVSFHSRRPRVQRQDFIEHHSDDKVTAAQSSAPGTSARPMARSR